VLLPERNGKDLEDVPEEIREEMEFHLVAEFGEAVALALASDEEDCLEGEGSPEGTDP
jgi:ATP-dependent Lon protease